MITEDLARIFAGSFEHFFRGQPKFQGVSGAFSGVSTISGFSGFSGVAGHPAYTTLTNSIGVFLQWLLDISRLLSVTPYPKIHLHLYLQKRQQITQHNHHHHDCTLHHGISWGRKNTGGRLIILSFLLMGFIYG